MGTGLLLADMLCLNPGQTQDTGNMSRGAFVLPRGLLHHPKCLAVVRTCKGNFVYFVKCPVGSKGHLGILSHCVSEDIVFNLSAPTKRMFVVPIFMLFLQLIDKMFYIL